MRAVSRGRNLNGQQARNYPRRLATDPLHASLDSDVVRDFIQIDRINTIGGVVFSGRVCRFSLVENKRLKHPLRPSFGLPRKRSEKLENYRA